MKFFIKILLLNFTLIITVRALSVDNDNSARKLLAADNTLGTNTYEAVSNTKESIKNTVEKIASGNSEAIGEAIGDIAISATLTKGVSSIASKAEKLSGAAATAGKAAKAGKTLYSEATYKAFEKQLSNDGMKSILKTQSRIQKNLTEHMQELAEIKKAGGYYSSVEREIRTFQSQLEAIKDLLK